MLPRVVLEAEQAPHTDDTQSSQAPNSRIPMLRPGPDVLRYGFVPEADEASFVSLRNHIASLDVLVLGWLRLGEDGLVSTDAPIELRRWVKAVAPQLGVFSLLQLAEPGADAEDRKAAFAPLTSPGGRMSVVQTAIKHVQRYDVTGITVDATQVTVEQSQDFYAFLTALSERLSARHVKLGVVVSPDNDAASPDVIAKLADVVFVTAFKQVPVQPGPLADQTWFNDVVQKRLSAVDPDKLVVTIGSFGVYWPKRSEYREVSVTEAWSLLENSRYRFDFENPVLNPSFTSSLTGSTGWYLDAVTAYNQLRAVLPLKPAGVGLWQLGTEDPSIWQLLSKCPGCVGSFKDGGLARFSSGVEVRYEGAGEVLLPRTPEREGRRDLMFDQTRQLIVGQTIRVLPKPIVIDRVGHRSDRVVALTFDDGPDPKYTPQILDVLREKGVPAAFFVVGSQGAKYPAILKRMYDEGHDIGNHTFTHINTSNTSPDVLKVELNATQRLLESAVGARTALFRPPYAGDSEPTTSNEATILALAAKLGYVTVGMHIDPHDWMRPFPKQIVSEVVEDVMQGAGSVVLLHDAGGNRSSTVDALPQIIDKLRAHGVRFVSLYELLRLDRGEVMPPIDRSDVISASLNAWSFAFYREFSNAVAILFITGIALGLLRAFLLAVGAFLHAWKEARRKGLSWQPESVAVLIPAYNEAKVINAAIRALLRSRCTLPFEIIVIDDGSTDGTAGLVKSAFPGNDRIKVIEKPNGGKWTALNAGLESTNAEVVVALDADTIFEPETLVWLLRHFSDPKVAAVAGAAKVGNTTTLMAHFQELEYLTSQNLERRALELLNAITVVPGSIGAWRRSAVVKVGGYAGDTLAEDADLTMRLEADGWKIVYDSHAVAHTEAPERVRAFLKQRFRWVFGTLQAAYKNARSLRKARSAWLGIGNIIVFHFLFALVGPVIDLAIVWSIFTAFNPAWEHTAESAASPVFTMLMYYAIFQLVEVAAASLAIYLDRRRNFWRVFPLLFLQRFCYRQLLCWIALRAFIAMCQGRIVRWGSVARMGRLSQAYQTAGSGVRPVATATAVSGSSPAIAQAALSEQSTRAPTPAREPEHPPRKKWAWRSVSLGIPTAVAACCLLLLVQIPELTHLLPMARPIVVAFDKATAGQDLQGDDRVEVADAKTTKLQTRVASHETLREESIAYETLTASAMMSPIMERVEAVEVISLEMSPAEEIVAMEPHAERDVVAVNHAVSDEVGTEPLLVATVPLRNQSDDSGAVSDEHAPSRNGDENEDPAPSTSTAAVQEAGQLGAEVASGSDGTSRDTLATSVAMAKVLLPEPKPPVARPEGEIAGDDEAPGTVVSLTETARVAEARARVAAEEASERKRKRKVHHRKPKTYTSAVSSGSRRMLNAMR